MGNLKILLASSEVVPFSKTGGLADVAAALPVALARRGHEVRVITPCYRSVCEGGFPVAETGRRVRVPLSSRWEEAEILEGELDEGVGVWFLKKDAYYDRAELYRTEEGDYPDNASRFVFLSKAIMETPRLLGFRPDILHCNDWQTGLAPLYLRNVRGTDPFLQNTGSLFTVHNLAYQGTFWHLDMHLTGLPWSYFTPEGIEFHGKISLLKAGLVYADRLNTVSGRYSKEIQSPEYGCGLEGILRKRSKDLSGILNGADYGVWNPETDPLIAKNYSPGSIGGKTACKKDLMAAFSLGGKTCRPLIGMVGRLADQKGLDIFAEVVDGILDLGFGLVLLGKGEEAYHDLFRSLARRFPEQVGVRIGFDNALAHKIEAGSDFFLMPSRYEPCGLNQMYSLKYGTVPIVRATGGLDDTIRNFNPETGKGNGFKFRAYTGKALFGKVREALSVYDDKGAWKRLRENAMAEDFSWDRSAGEYEKLYRRVLKTLP